VLTPSGYEAKTAVEFTCRESELLSEACGGDVPKTAGAGMQPGLTGATLPTAGNQ